MPRSIPKREGKLEIRAGRFGQFPAQRHGQGPIRRCGGWRGRPGELQRAKVRACLQAFHGRRRSVHGVDRDRIARIGALLDQAARACQQESDDAGMIGIRLSPAHIGHLRPFLQPCGQFGFELRLRPRRRDVLGVQPDLRHIGTELPARIGRNDA